MSVESSKDVRRRCCPAVNQQCAAPCQECVSACALSYCYQGFRPIHQGFINTQIASLLTVLQLLS